MNTTIDISLYPLNADYIPPIDEFIARIRAYEGLTVKVNALSTQVSGEYSHVMAAVQEAIRATFANDGKFVFAMKVLKGDLLD